MWSVTTWLIVINLAVYILNGLTKSPSNDYVGWLDLWGYFSADTVVYRLQLWRFITFQFLHAGLEHIVFNMLSLYFFGPLIEGYLGSRRYLAFYLLCGAAGGALYLILWRMGILQEGAATPLVGASAGIFGVLVAGARIAPDTTVMLLFPPIPMRLRVLALILLGIAVWVVFANGANAGGQAAHLGGAALGALLIWHPEWLSFVDRLSWRRRRRGRFSSDDWR